MTKHPTGVRTRVLLEVGKRRTFAAALDWPGWVRSGKTPEAALTELDAYAERFGAVASRACITFRDHHDFDVVEEVSGNGTTDFGAPDAIAASDHDSWDNDAELERHLAILTASWDLLDEVATTVSPSLRRGPRGGGRDRDQVVAHVIAAEASYVRRIGVRHRAPDPADHAAVEALRNDVLASLRTPPASIPGKPWPARYAIRRVTWHVLDHVWEIEDKSLV